MGLLEFLNINNHLILTKMEKKYQRFNFLLKYKSCIIVVLLFLTCTFSVKAQKTDSIRDDRDGKTYKTVIIGKQTWLAQNLNFETGKGSWCYDDKKSYCDIYGRLYNWEAAKMSCPKGWHLPSDEEWSKLVDFLGGKNVASSKMKETCETYWVKANTSNNSGFNALPGGFHFLDDYTDGGFMDIGLNGTWWSSTAMPKLANKLSIMEDGSIDRSNLNKKHSYSVRCIKDNVIK